MEMSSFLMNSGAYTDPKFGGADEYSQGTYLPHTTDYYNQHIQEPFMPFLRFKDIRTLDMI